MSQNLSSAAVVIGPLRVKVITCLNDDPVLKFIVGLVPDACLWQGQPWETTSCLWAMSSFLCFITVACSYFDLLVSL